MHFAPVSRNHGIQCGQHVGQWEGKCTTFQGLCSQGETGATHVRVPVYTFAVLVPLSLGWLREGNSPGHHRFSPPASSSPPKTCDIPRALSLFAHAVATQTLLLSGLVKRAFVRARSGTVRVSFCSVSVVLSFARQRREFLYNSMPAPKFVGMESKANCYGTSRLLERRDDGSARPQLLCHVCAVASSHSVCPYPSPVAYALVGSNRTQVLVL